MLGENDDKFARVVARAMAGKQLEAALAAVGAKFFCGGMYYDAWQARLNGIDFAVIRLKTSKYGTMSNSLFFSSDKRQFDPTDIQGMRMIGHEVCGTIVNVA